MTQTEPLPKKEIVATRQPASTAREERRLPGLRLAVLAGVLLWLACPPVTAWPLAWIALAPLILSVTRAQRLRQALWRGYVFGWVYLGMVWYWIGLTIVAWLDGSPIGWAAWFGLTLLMAGFYAAWGGAAWWLARRTTGGGRIVALAAAWVIMEWARSLGTLSMPWAQLSYTQYHFLPVLQVADLTGAYGVSFLLMLVNGAVAEWWSRRGQPGSARRVWGSLAVAALACVYGLARLAQPEGGRPLSVAAMQPNFRLHETRQDLFRDLQTLDDLTRRAYAAIDPPPALYVWSESAAPVDALNYLPTRNTLTRLAQVYHAPLLVGSRVEDPQTGAESNASVLFCPDGAAPARYNKRHLVPFGEFIPFRHALPAFLDSTFHFFDTDVMPGEGAAVLRFTDPHAGTVALGPFICYEAVYPHFAREMTRAGANLLVTQSNDGWFHSEAAMEQHLAAVVLRAIENRRNIARSTLTGVTCLLDSRGRVLARAPINTPAFVVHALQLQEGQTLYARLGDWFVALCGLGLIVLAWRGKGRPGRRADAPDSPKPSQTGASA
ncbi:MAG TPA: apolipoprotein N-acyltransferase [Chthonomonadaceae bacterium]|nr:apolipoprotein N-acyltransferase [Chthonomonadaceae bacterium]